MRITDIFKKKNQTYSFEFFPPKTEAGFAHLIDTIKELKQFNPDYVSVTYGAMGTTQEKTIEITNKIQNELNITAMAHLTCVGATSNRLEEIIQRFRELGIMNIMRALRGDPPQGQSEFIQASGGFRNATDLIRLIRKLEGFSIGAAGYPEGHIEAKSLDTDVEFLKMKMDMGADFIVTQLFLDNSFYFRFQELAIKKGVNLRIIPGIMPVSNYQQINKFSAMCGCTIPEALAKKLFKVRDNKEEIAKIGVEYASQQCIDLIKSGAPGLHFYTLNKSTATRDIFKALQNEGLVI